jgi:hypothetical protein
VLGRPLVHVDDLHTDSVLLQEQGRDQTDRTGANDEDLRIGKTGHRASSSRAPRKNCSPEADPVIVARAMPWTRSPQTRHR